MEHYRLLGKTELWIKPIRLKGANLEAIAKAAASVLDLPPHLVAVTDAGTDTLTIDLLTDLVDPRQIIGKERAFLEAVGACPGVHLASDSRVHSDGVLGLIVMTTQDGEQLVRATEGILSEVEERVAKRVIVFPTGGEVEDGAIEDTNTPMISDRLAAAGYIVQAGPVLRDDAALITEALNQAANAGYGLILTTGGVGAEAKDQTIEALLLLDPTAATPYVLKFARGTGRHVKDGVRIGVGEVAGARIACLPGPSGEVSLCLDMLIEGLAQGCSKEALAEKVAQSLQRKFAGDCPSHHA